MPVWIKSSLIAVAVALAAVSAKAQVEAPAPPEPPAVPDVPAIVEVPAQAPRAEEMRLLELALAQAAGAVDGQRAAVEERAQQDAAEADALRQHVRAFAVAAPGAKKEKAAFLGITTSPVPASLRQQLKLQKGLGLVVETIEKDSPAEQAGVQQYDVLQKLNE